MKHERAISKSGLRHAATVQPTVLRSVGILLAVALSGCTSLPTDLAANDTPNIERVYSSRARISSVLVDDRNGSLLVWGTLEKRIPGRGSIPGHLHVTALGYDGSVLEEETTGYYRRNNKSSKSRFSLEFSVAPKDVHTLRIRHHVGEDVGYQMVTESSLPDRKAPQILPT